MGKKAYTDLRPGGWVGYWVELHNDALHDEPREQCAECQATMEEHGRMPPRQMLLRAYEQLKRPEFKIPIPKALRQAVFKRDSYTCQHCGSQDRLCADHIIAEVRGGPTTLENLQTLCRTCNSRKSDK